MRFLEQLQDVQIVFAVFTVFLFVHTSNGIINYEYNKLNSSI